MKRVPITERQRRISEGLRLAWTRRKDKQMTRLSISLTTESPAFEGNGAGYEAARILRELADRLEINSASLDLLTELPVLDIDGNRVGECTLSTE